jgi:hypothetical protein
MQRILVGLIVASLCVGALATTGAPAVTKGGEIEGCVSVENDGATSKEKLHIQDRMRKHHKGNVKATGTMNMTMPFTLDGSGNALVSFTYTTFGPTTYLITVNGTGRQAPVSYTVHFTLAQANDVTKQSCTLSN